jgi:hypothetical protein
MAIQNAQLCFDTGKTQSFNYSSFPGTTIGNSVLFKEACFEIIGSSDPSSLDIPNASYTDCYECHSTNNAVILVEPCFGGISDRYFFTVTDFGFVPQLNGIYYLNFVSPLTGGLIKSCFSIRDIKNNAKDIPISVLTEVPVLETNCQTCFTGNSKSYAVVRCVTDTIDFIELLDDSYNGHTITYTVGLDRYCGKVKEQQIGIITGFFVSDYSDGSGDEICQSCNDTVSDKRLLTNCLDGSVEVVWSSPFFESGEISHLNSKFGCFSVGPITAATVTFTDSFLDFDPQPTCQDCIQCNGVGLALTPCGGGIQYNVTSYQYASAGDVIYDPLLDTCSTVDYVQNGGGGDYTFYSFLTGGTSCGTCGSIETPISYYAEECVTGNIVVVTFDSTSTIGIGDIVRAKWGTSDFLCYTITSLYDNSLGYDFYYSDTTTSFTGCTECETSGSLGVTLVNCNTYEESYVNVSIPTWVAMTGYDDSLGAQVVKGSDGECYYLVNDCPITPIYDTFTTNEYFYYCFQCIPAGSSSCKCYYGVGTPESPVEGTYLDCNPVSAQTKTFYSDNGLIKFCGNLLDGSNILDSGKFCEENGCPNFCCECYTITNNNASKIYVQYLDCDNNLISLEVEGNSGSTFCGLNVQYLTLGNFTPKVPNNVVTTIDVCVNGQCLASLSTKDQLLYSIKTTLGPCPSNCCGKNARAGAYLLKNNGNTPGTYSIR